jgi:hypothetical protein
MLHFQRLTNIKELKLFVQRSKPIVMDDNKTNDSWQFW